ncbi:MAG: tetrahydromethanopterin S-methyltransferase subunit H [Candidatus Micrarchaeota archaeon]
MFRFKNRQKVCDVSGVKIGGQPGENATALAGTIFYGKHEIVRDARSGVFEKAEAAKLIKSMEEASAQTHVPGLLQIFFETQEAGERYVDFCAEQTKMPLVIDSADGVARAKVAEYCSEIGIAERVIYNSVNLSITEKELEILADANCYSAIVLAFNPTGAGVEGKIKLLEDGAGIVKEGLLAIAERVGMKNLLIDPAALPFGQKSSHLHALPALKAKYGLPVGCGIHNVPSAWKWLKKRREAHVADIASNLVPITLGADFVLFGPIENAGDVFPATAMADIMVAEAMSIHGVKPVKEHPANYLL